MCLSRSVYVSIAYAYTCVSIAYAYQSINLLLFLQKQNLATAISLVCLTRDTYIVYKCTLVH